MPCMKIMPPGRPRTRAIALNMSAPTVLFVLDRLLAAGLPERVMMTAFGPGFTCAGMVIER